MKIQRPKAGDFPCIHEISRRVTAHLALAPAMDALAFAVPGCGGGYLKIVSTKVAGQTHETGACHRWRTEMSAYLDRSVLFRSIEKLALKSWIGG